MDLKLGRVPQGGLNITFKPKKSQPSTYGSHKGIMKIAPQTAFCRDFAELLQDFPTRVQQNRHNFCPVHGNAVIFLQKHTKLNQTKSHQSLGLQYEPILSYPAIFQCEGHMPPPSCEIGLKSIDHATLLHSITCSYKIVKQEK